jgi:serine kinase of HPr protein (carbohydrate metabolism regulator)
MRTRSISVQRLLAGSEVRLGLRRVICEKGYANRLRHVQVRHCIYRGVGGSSGHDIILVMDPSQDRPLTRKDEETCLIFLEEIRAAKISCIFISTSDRVPDHLQYFTEQTGIPLLTSAYDAFLLESRLMGLLRGKINHHIRVHGVLLKMFGLGVLIMGDSGAGKTTAGMMLVQKGHTWIADDVVEIKKRHGKRLYASRCQSTRDLIDLKESGIRNPQSLFAGRRQADGTDLHLILEMERRREVSGRRSLEGCQGVREIMGMQIPCIQIPFFRDGDLDALKIEERVKAFIGDGGTS